MAGGAATGVPGVAREAAPCWSRCSRRRRRMRALIVVLAVLVLSRHVDEPLAPWGASHHPTDAPKRHVEEISAGRHAYTVRQGGTMDGENCRSPIGVGM